MRFPSYILIGRTFLSCLAGTFNYCALSGEWLLCNNSVYGSEIL